MKITDISMEIDEVSLPGSAGRPFIGRIRAHASVEDGENLFDAARDLANVVRAQREQVELRGAEIDTGAS